MVGQYVLNELNKDVLPLCVCALGRLKSELVPGPGVDLCLSTSGV